jgi:GDPmannose 4,6-dehydratase
MGAETKTAFITGICGQVGSYMAEHLLSLGYSVHGLVRRTSITARPRIDHLQGNPRLHLHYGDLLDSGSLFRLLRDIQPAEIYHLAAQSHVAVSFHEPEHTADVDYLGTARLLEAYRQTCPQARFYFASSSEIFGSSPPPQHENTPFAPCSPYGIAKLAATWLCRNYRQAYGLHINCGICFNVESPRRGESFVTRKIARGVARIALGLDREPIKLGNLSAMRDWMHAMDAVRAMHLMLQQEKPDDYVLATGRSVSVGQFLLKALSAAGICPSDIRPAVVIADYLRPVDVPHLHGDASKACRAMGWQPQITLEQLAAEMVESDLEAAKAEATMRRVLQRS